MNSWFAANVLGPTREAEPAAPTYFIIALSKRNRSINELRKFLFFRLEKFLNSETDGFTVETWRNEPRESADFKCVRLQSGEKSDSDGETPCDGVITKDDKKFRSRSRSLVRSRLLRTRDVMFTGQNDTAERQR